MYLLKELLLGNHHKKSAHAKGVFVSVLMFFLAIAVYVAYKTMNINCLCCLNCKGKRCDCDLEKNFGNSENESRDYLKSVSETDRDE
ncbi:MAG: hypothetical protein LBT82_00310 [Oscillospiraceae bacterium]|jgi:hypothetical protein|nr:hypothetical protein [Oscillospiraceae bacterium]